MTALWITAACVLYLGLGIVLAALTPKKFVTQELGWIALFWPAMFFMFVFLFVVEVCSMLAASLRDRMTKSEEVNDA